mmetsp:Transcript_53734/g.96601  ORF Transcript_53734/g.96601 Transcript_53734/m.96601 type:complete len:397 (+) Transcript_53734:78-1268(+)
MIIRNISRAASTMARPTLRGVVFDMDGTLTVPNLDFVEMYKRCGVPSSKDLLQEVNAMAAPEKDAAWKVIDDMEEEGRRTLQLMTGTVELAKWLGQHQIPTAIVTRNSSQTLNHFLSCLWEPAGLAPFSVAVSRDDDFPAKPDPTALNAIAARWGLPVSRDLLMVGDSPSNDVGFGKAAGVSTALLDSNRKYVEGGKDSDADMSFEHLFQLPGLIWQNFDINGDLGGPLKKYPVPVATTDAAKAAIAADLETLGTLPAEELNSTDGSGNTPLIWAANEGHLEVVDFLLSANVDVNVRGFLGATALHRAARYGHMEVLERLLSAPGINCDIANDKMQYPLHFAAFKLQPHAVHMLMEAGASTIVLDRKGRTPAEDTSDETIRQAILDFRAKSSQSKI